MPSTVRGEVVSWPVYATALSTRQDPTRARRAAPWRRLHAMGHSVSSGSERDDEPSARATRLQPAVGLSSALRGVGGSHAQGDGTRLHELPEAVQFLELAVVRAHQIGRASCRARVKRWCGARAIKKDS